MAEKCNVNLDEINGRIESVIMTYRIMESTIDELVADFTQELQSIADDYILSNITEVVDSIYSVLQVQGAIDLNPSVFNVKNIRNVLEGASQGLINTNNFQASAEQASYQESEQVQLRRNITSQFLDNAYGMVSEARKQAIDSANRNLFDALFINRGSIEGINIGLVKTNLDLNRNIRTYQEQLLRKIVNYLNSIITPSMSIPEEQKNALSNPRLYNDNTNTGILTVLRPLINKYLSRDAFKSESDPTGRALDSLRSLYNIANNPSDSGRDAARLRLDAYNANVILQNFDSYLDVTLGDVIEIQDVGVKTGKDNKYAIGKKTSKLLNTWRSSEDIDVESEADFITKLAINTIPLYNWQVDTVTNKYLTFADYQYIIGKIKDLAWNEKSILGTIGTRNLLGVFQKPAYWDQLSPETKKEIEKLVKQTKAPVRFSTIINQIRRNPRKYLGIVFDLLNNQEFQKAIGFDSNTFEENDLNVIYSLNKGIFGIQESKSLYTLTDLDGETDFYSFITQVADTIFNVNYVQYYRDSDGILQARTFISQNVNNLRRGIETTINASNNTNTIKDFKDYENNLQLQSNSLNQITFTIPGTDLTIVVNTSGVVKFRENGNEVSTFEKFLQNPYVLQFLDQKLRLGITNNIDLQNALRSAFKSKSAAVQNLLSFASRIVLNQHIIHNYIDPIAEVNKKEQKIKEIFGSNSIKYNKQLDITEVISSYDIPNLRTIAIAKANVLGVTTATQTKDGSGNGQSMQTQSRLLGSQKAQFELQESQPWSATKDCLILTVPGLYEGVYTAKEYYDDLEGSKSFVDMCVSEFVYSSFVSDYIGGLIERKTENGALDTNALVGNNHVMFLPSVNSDKGTIGRIVINLNKEIETKDGTLKSIRQFNHEELRWLIAKQFGNIYTRMYNAVKEDWDIVNNYIQNVLNIQGCPNLGFDYLNNFKSFNTWWYQNQASLTEFGKSPAEFIKNVVLRFNQAHRLNPLTLIDQTHFKVQKQTLNIDKKFVKIKGALTHSQVLVSQIARYNPNFLTNLGVDITSYPSEEIFWNTKHKEVLKSLLKSRFQINTTAKTQKELVYLREKYPTWINDSGDVILAKIEHNGNTINITSSRDLIALKSENNSDADFIDSLSKIKLHPAVETWNYLSYLFTQEFMDCTVGSFINHPEKSKGSSEDEIRLEAQLKGTDPTSALHERVLKREAAHFQAQHKRNVSFTAAMHEFQLNLLNGIPEEYNIAVIEDIKDYQGTITGLINEIKPFDGATYVNPFVVLLENYSLGGARAGITKKQFVHFKNERTGGGGIIKTAGFGLTNDWIRNSPFLHHMMQKMTDHIWLNENGSQAVVNITKDYMENTISHENMYFEENGRVFKISSIESLGNNQYRRVLREIQIDENGNPMKNAYIGKEIIQEPILINTNYKLWQFFGGDRSMSENGEYLEYSNSSVENVVKIMNKVGTRKHNGPIKTQDDLWQPLKQVDVHYLATAGAVKQGAANINSANKYTDNVAYDTQRIKMYQAGIQLDKEHHADDAELSLMTQVISACAAKGYTFEAVTNLYDALRKSTEIGIKEHLNAVKQYITSGDPSGVQEAMYEAIIHSLGTGDSNSFAYLVALDLIRQAKEGKKIKFSEASLPLSDKTVYPKIFSTVASYLTNTGIKQKIPGILSVLTPSYNVFKIYAGRKLEAYKNPREDLAKEQANFDALPVFDINNPLTNISNIDLGRTYKITRIGLDGSILEPEWKLIATPLDYKHLKDEIDSGLVARVVEAVIDRQGNPLGRDLASYNVRFQSIDGQYFQLWDLDSAQNLYRINEIKEDDLTSEQKIQKLAELSQDILGQVVDSDVLERLVRRTLQKDLMNLSQTTPDVISQYEELLNSQGTFQPTPTQEQISYQWAVNAPNAYEVSSAGDNRFSALFARFAQDTQFMGQDISNMTIEDVYQKVIKKSGKGLPPAQDSILYNPNLTTKSAREDFSYNTAYLPLWQLWASQNPTLIEELRQAVKGRTLTDKFAPNTTVTQARALADILTQTENNYSSSTRIEDRITDPIVANNLRKLTPALQNAILSYPMGDYDSNITQEQWEKAVRKWWEAVDHLNEQEHAFLIRILGDEIGEPDTYEVASISYFLHTGRIFKEDYNKISTERANALNQKFREQKDAGTFNITPNEYRYQHLVLQEQVQEELRSIAQVKDDSSHIPGIKDNLFEQESVVDLQSWYDRYAQWVNIYLGTGNGSELILPTFSGRVTAENFATVEPLVSQAIINSTKVRIGKDLKTVNKSSINIQAYELIMPKTFATNFGLKQFDSLSEIENNPDWFVEQYIRNSEVKIHHNNYSVALKNSTGNHTYLLSKSQLNSITEDLIKVDKDNIGIIYLDGKNLRFDSKGNILYETTDDYELYVDSQGNEVIVTDDFKFYINNTSFESIQFSEVLQNRPQIFEQVLTGISESSNKTAKRIFRFIGYNKRRRNFNEAYNNSIIYNTIPSRDDPNYENNIVVRSLREKHTSFIKALDVVAARIPSQSMQSFMPMKVVAFDNPDINTAYVSTMQILLQGSDYDVDAVSIATYDIDRGGKLLLWSPYANIENIENLNASLQLPIPTGQELQFKESKTYLPEAAFVAKYRHLFSINRLYVDEMASETDLDVNFKTNMTAQDIIDLGNFLKEVQTLTIPAKRYYESFARELNNTGFLEGNINANYVASFFAKLKQLVDNHNLYFDSISTYTL